MYNYVYNISPRIQATCFAIGPGYYKHQVLPIVNTMVVPGHGRDVSGVRSPFAPGIPRFAPGVAAPNGPGCPGARETTDTKKG